MTRHVQQFFAFHVIVGRLEKLRVEVGVSTEHIEVGKNASGYADFKTLHPLLALKHQLPRRSIRIIDAGIGFIDPENRALHA